MARPSTTLRRLKRKSNAPSTRTLKDCARRLSLASKAFIRPLSGVGLIAPVRRPKPLTRKSSQAFQLRNVELDELYSFAGEKHPAKQENDLEEVGQHWTHIAMARESRLMLEVVVGPRTQESATKLVEGAAKRLAPDCWPLWSSDGWEPYLFALTVVFAVLIHFIKGKGRGRPKDSQIAPDPRVRYGQVIKQRLGRRLVSVIRRVVFGVAELIPLKQISTSLLERLNGTIRQHVAPLHRKTRSFAKCRTALDTQTQLFKSYYNLCRKHGTLKGKTPAQAAGLSDHCWTLRELLTFNCHFPKIEMSKAEFFCKSA
jgi:IS1 family transposase